MKNLARIFFSSLLMLVLATSLVSCSKDEEPAPGPAGAVAAPQKSDAVKLLENFVKAVNAKDVEAITSFVAEEGKGNIGFLSSGDFSLELLEVVDEKTEGDTAVIIAKLKAKMGEMEETNSFEISCEKVNGDWKIKNVKPYKAPENSDNTEK